MLKPRQQASAHLLQDATWQLAGRRQYSCVALSRTAAANSFLQAAMPPQQQPLTAADLTQEAMRFCFLQAVTPPQQQQ